MLPPKFKERHGRQNPAVTSSPSASYHTSATFHTPDTPSSLRHALTGAWLLQSYIAHPMPDQFSSRNRIPQITTTSPNKTTVRSPSSPAPPSQKPIYPLTKHATGQIMYTPDGYISAHLLIPGQKSFTPGVGTEADWAECGRRYVGYGGPYYITEEDIEGASADEGCEGDGESSPGIRVPSGGRRKQKRLVLRHEMRVSSLPESRGNIQVRDWRFEDEGRTLILSSDEGQVIKGELRRPELTWKRATDNTEGVPPDMH